MCPCRPRNRNNHISESKILNAVESNTLKNCILYFSTSIRARFRQTTGRPRTPVRRHDVGRRRAAHVKVPALERRMVLEWRSVRSRQRAPAPVLQLPAILIELYIPRCAAARDDLPFSPLLISLYQLSISIYKLSIRPPPYSSDVPIRRPSLSAEAVQAPQARD